MQSWGQLVTNLRSPGAILGPTLAHIGSNFVHIGANLGTNGAYVSSHEVIWALTWANPAPHRADQTGYGADLAATWGRLGAELCHLVVNLVLISLVRGTTWVQ